MIGAQIATGTVQHKQVVLKLDPVFIRAMAMKESSLDSYKIGDLKLANHAYGIFQIRQPVLTDVNETFGTHYTINDIRPMNGSNAEKVKSIRNSLMVMRMYLQRYGEHYEHVTGRKLTMEVMARCWNGGGPNGWQKECTVKYWNIVKGYIEKAINKENGNMT
jgi:hypothetical protein